MPRKSNRPLLIAVALALFLPIALLQTKLIDPLRGQYFPGGRNTGEAAKVLPIEFALGAATGFREAIAGLLWVRTDEFFHNGDYEAITPMIRIITWLDPHQTDVYQTGAWHMDYNFTDSSQRSDRRYIPLAIALMREGIENNPTDPDMQMDLGSTHYFRKIADFPRASDAFRSGQKVVDMLQAASARDPGDSDLRQQAQEAARTVTTLGHGLAHSLEAEGDIPGAIKQWQYCVAAHQANLNNGIGKDHGEEQSLTNAQKNLNEMQLRAKWRPRDAKTPIDLKFSAQLVRVRPKVFRVQGTMNAIGSKGFVLETGQAQWVPTDGCRVEIRLEDQGYKMKPISSFSLSSLNLDNSVTIMQDAASERGGKFFKEIDMSQDPTMYSFTAPRYTVTLWFNPANPNDCPPQVQDRIGWHGEGMTDAKYLDVTGVVPDDTTAPVRGLRQIKKTFTLTREDILGQGEKTFQ